MATLSILTEPVKTLKNKKQKQKKKKKYRIAIAFCDGQGGWETRGTWLDATSTRPSDWFRHPSGPKDFHNALA